MLRCRLRPAWTFLARVVFCILTAINLVLLGLFGSTWPWLNLAWLSLPGFVWWLHVEQRTLQRLVALFVERAAQPLKLLKVDESGNRVRGKT